MALDVILVNMPYASIERPSIGLSLLKSALNQETISAKILYPNLLFAEEIGVHVYDLICRCHSHSLAGEWTFSNVAFPDYESNHAEYFQHIDMGIRCLEPILRSFNSKLSIIDLLWKLRKKAPVFIDQIAKTIIEENPKIVGCTTTFQQHCPSLALLKRIKELNPDIVTMIGGANCEGTMGVISHKECSWIDYVISGEADQLFPILCKKILEKDSELNLEEIPDGVIAPIHRRLGEVSYQKLLEVPPRAKVKDINESPIPDFKDYFSLLKTISISSWIRPGLLMESSRGCWWGAKSHCKFCGLNGENLNYRSKDPERVIEELDFLIKEYGIRNISIVDNIFDMNYLNTVIPVLANREEKYDIFYETTACLKKEQLELLANAGVRWIQPGVESLNDMILKKIGKGTTTRQNIQLLKWAQEFGMYIIWILLYDIPGVSDEEYIKMSEILPLITHLQPPGGLSFIQFNRFSPYQLNPEKFNLNLSPDRSFSYVYPWSKASIEKFAYYFDDYTVDRKQIYPFTQSELKCPGLQAIGKNYRDWHRKWDGYWSFLNFLLIIQI